jgi:hypothetical protein
VKDAAVTGGVTEEPHARRSVRAIWARDMESTDSSVGNVFGSDENPHQPLTRSNRIDIVRESSDFSQATQGRPYAPAPVDVHTLTLSSLGGWLDAHGTWDELNPFGDVLEWRHRATLGRDQYVKVVEKGALCPFGHATTIVTISERKILRNNGIPAAYLTRRQRFFPIQRVRYYDQRILDDGRRMPFRKIEIVTHGSVDIDDRAGDSLFSPFGGEAYHEFTQQPFMPLVDNRPLLLVFRGTDWRGETHTFRSPFVFVYASASDGQKPLYDNAAMKTLRDKWNEFGIAGDADLDKAEPQRRSFGGARIAFADPQGEGQTTIETLTVRFNVGEAVNPGEAVNQPGFQPEMLDATVRLGQIEALTGGTAAPTIAYDARYLHPANGAENNGGIWANVAANAPTVAFSADRSGGLATPNFSVAALSRLRGPVGGGGDLTSLYEGTFKPADFFFGEPAMLLGGVSLVDVLAESVELDGPHAPMLSSTDTGDAIESTYTWHPLLRPHPIVVADTDTSFVLEAKVHTNKADPSQSTISVLGELKNFDVRVFGDGAEHFLTLSVNRARFVAEPAKKTTVDVDIAGATFAGPLRFVNALKDYLSFAGGGVAVDVTPSAVELSATIPLPAITIGVFSLSNLSFGAGFVIPIDGSPVRARFNFASREDPFHVTVMALGGGGWVQLAVGVDGVESFDIGIEVGAQLALDVGVASGGVEAFFGCYFGYEKGVGTAFGAYFRVRGEVEVLDLVGVSIEMRLELQYLHKEATGQDILTGRATLVVEIDVPLVSPTVEITCEKSFGGDPADPTFAEYMTADVWANEYCAAFAAVGG